MLTEITALEEFIKHLDDREQVAAKLVEITAFFRNIFWVLFEKEEKDLFREIDNFMRSGVGPRAVMINEHEVIRITNVMLETFIANYLILDDSIVTRRIIVENVNHFIEFSRVRINKENNLFANTLDMDLCSHKRARVLKNSLKWTSGRICKLICHICIKKYYLGAKNDSAR